MLYLFYLWFNFEKYFKQENKFNKNWYLFLFLSLNHNAISIGVTLIYLILSKKENVIRVASVIIPTQLIGNLLINYYLNIIKFPAEEDFVLFLMTM